MENQNSNPSPVGQAPVDQNSKRSGLIREAAAISFILLILAIIGAADIYFKSSLNHKQPAGQNTNLLPKNTDKPQSTDLKPDNTVNPELVFNPEEALKNIGISEAKPFSQYKQESSNYKPSIPDYEINLSELKNLADFGKKSFDGQLKPMVFSDSQKQALEQNNFFVVQNNDKFYDKDPNSGTMRLDDWFDLYKSIEGPDDAKYRAPENSVYISSDFALHVYHKLLDKEFEYIEQQEFYPRLKDITDTTLASSIQAYNNSSSESDKESYQRLIAYFAVPDAIINSSYDFYKNGTLVDDGSDTKEAIIANLDKMKDKIPAASYDLAKQEIELVLAAKDRAVSPIFGKYQSEAGLEFQEDYTQYGPRSHYGKNPTLRSYFRSMMWYGRQNFLAKSPELTKDAVNIVLMMNQLKSHLDPKLDPPISLVKEWEDIYEPTVFFVGKSDDLGLYEYQKVLNDNKSMPMGDGFISKVQSDVAKLKNPQIMSSLVVGDAVLDASKEELQNKTKGFRFMGQRFTPDAFVFSTLTQGDEKPDPKTGERLPSMPTALMVMTSFGNKTADSLLNNWVKTDAPNSKNVIADRIDTLKTYFNGLPQDTWTQNIYWSWIYTLRSLSQDDLNMSGYPNFMKNNDWNKKNLQGALGSWTELKHDTLLYAKQSYAELGGGGDDDNKVPPVPKGYVEPNIEFWDRLVALSKMTKEGLDERGLLEPEFQGRNEDLITSLEFFRRIAVAELNNEKISDADFESLRIQAGQLKWVLRPLPSEAGTEDLARSALIADVHTDGVKGKILYEADGIPNYIYVAVKDANGTRLTKGLVYSYYEFTNPLDKRLTDTDWKGWIYSEDGSHIPPMPEWGKSLIK